MKPSRVEIISIILSLVFVIGAAAVLLVGEGRKNDGSFEIKTAKTPAALSENSEIPLDENSGTISQGEKININTAAKEDFQSLYGIGEALSLAIVEYREKSGPFSQIEDIMLVSGIGEAKFNDIREYISID